MTVLTATLFTAPTKQKSPHSLHGQDTQGKHTTAHARLETRPRPQCPRLQQIEKHMLPSQGSLAMHVLTRLLTESGLANVNGDVSTRQVAIRPDRRHADDKIATRDACPPARPRLRHEPVICCLRSSYPSTSRVGGIQLPCPIIFNIYASLLILLNLMKIPDLSPLK